MENLLKISLITSILGIFLLLFLSNFLNPKLTEIAKINNKMLNKEVKVQGTVFSIRTYEDSNFQVISIKDSTGEIDITTNKILNINKNQNIITIGKVQEYKGNLQINADKILREN